MIIRTLFFAYLLTVAVALDLGWSSGPKYYKNGDKVDLLLNKVESDNTQLPFSYRRLPFVCPGALDPIPLTLGEILKGDRIWNSLYDLRFGLDAPCVRLCDLVSKESGISRADQLIRQGYVVHWLVDGLPGATTFVSSNHHNKYYAAGFPLGFVEKDISYIYNHVMLVIRYHREKKSGLNTIVGFEVYPKSVSNELCPGSSKDYENFALTFKKLPNGELETKKTTIPYTYSVYWREDNSIDYKSRWDLYYENDTHQSHHSIHWLSFVNSLVLLFFVSLVVAVVLVRALKKEVQNLASLPTTVDFESTSWKGLVNQVNRPPRFALGLSVLVAGGIQMLFATIAVIGIFVINNKFNFSKSKSQSTFFNNHQGAFFSYSILFFVLSGIVASYSGIILHKAFHNTTVTYPIHRTATLSLIYTGFLPGLILLVVLTLNFFVWAKESSNALPFGTIVVFFLLLIFIVLPLGLIGGIFGNRKSFKTPKSPIPTSSSPVIKEHFQTIKSRRSIFLNPFFSVIIFGLIPFGIVYVELLFVFNSVWLEKTTFYYMYSFLLITSIMLIISISESAIVATYISLAVYNNPNWHWLCFRVGSSTGWFIFGYSAYYFTYYLNIRDFVSILFYFTYMGLTSVLIGFGCGAVGVLTGLVFVRKIFGAVKVD